MSRCENERGGSRVEWGETAVPGRGQSQADIQKVLCPEGDSHRQTYRKFRA